MKVIGISGSPRKDGNTSILIQNVFDELNKKELKQSLFNWLEKK